MGKLKAAMMEGTYPGSHLYTVYEESEQGETKDLVNHPSHYTQGKYEVLPVLMDWFKEDPLAWQVAKYLSRYKHKGTPVQDLKKAEFYLKELINAVDSK